ncbi:hemerythrin family protein [Sulfurovum sp. bin170]|uniref:bacteriohemerythrin n=1 Tax=Sulfurovum sp. bin170 TaxID=2695268 RepID=UPI0013DFCBD9|nr:hemerythrin family protein [Sulfurovum sp. bin170]NEW60135.1 hemerythrin family protein [Sulfurovum sp. bin170]
MKLLQWKDAYSMGEIEIDKQHKGLFDLSNEIYKLVEAGVDDNEHFRELFMALNDYSIEHFIYEEMYIQEEGFPGLEEHIGQHLKFNDKLKELCVGIDKETHIKDIGEFVATWLVEHVINEDMKYKKFIETKK